jgi:hypothetical protein
MGTVALQSMLKRLTWPDVRAAASFVSIVEDGIGLFALLLRFGFDHLAYATSQAVEHSGHRTGRWELGCVIALGSQRLQSRLGRQTRRG